MTRLHSQRSDHIVLNQITIVNIFFFSGTQDIDEMERSIVIFSSFHMEIFAFANFPFFLVTKSCVCVCDIFGAIGCGEIVCAILLIFRRHFASMGHTILDMKFPISG